MLREEFHAGRVVVFGSLVHPGCFTAWSDVDVAAWGLRPEDTFRAMGRVMDLDTEIATNLVDVGACRASILRSIQRRGHPAVIGRYAVLASRIRQDLSELELVVSRVERAVRAARTNAEEQDLLLDSVALNLHDFYSGLECIFTHIASSVDQSVPAGSDSPRELLRQMTVEIPGLRPEVLSPEVAAEIDEYLRFRHMVRHIYAFELEPERIERLASRLRPAFENVRTALIAFATSLEGLSHET